MGLPTKTSSLAIVPDEAVWPAIQTIRRVHDSRQFPMWPPHINLIYPFAPERDYADVAKKLALVTASVEPMKIRFSRYAHFGGRVAYLVPECEADPGLARLHEACLSAVPEFRTLNRSGFQPHLTVGHFDSAQECETFLENCAPISLEVEISSISMLARDTMKHAFRTPLRVRMGSALQAVEFGSTEVYNPEIATKNMHRSVAEEQPELIKEFPMLANSQKSTFGFPGTASGMRTHAWNVHAAAQRLSKLKPEHLPASVAKLEHWLRRQGCCSISSPHSSSLVPPVALASKISELLQNDSPALQLCVAAHAQGTWSSNNASELADVDSDVVSASAQRATARLRSVAPWFMKQPLRGQALWLDSQAVSTHKLQPSALVDELVSCGLVRICGDTGKIGYSVKELVKMGSCKLQECHWTSCASKVASSRLSMSFGHSTIGDDASSQGRTKCILDAMKAVEVAFCSDTAPFLSVQCSTLPTKVHMKLEKEKGWSVLLEIHAVGEPASLDAVLSKVRDALEQEVLGRLDLVQFEVHDIDCDILCEGGREELGERLDQEPGRAGHALELLLSKLDVPDTESKGSGKGEVLLKGSGKGKFILDHRDLDEKESAKGEMLWKGSGKGSFNSDDPDSDTDQECSGKGKLLLKGSGKGALHVKGSGKGKGKKAGRNSKFMSALEWVLGCGLSTFAESSAVRVTCSKTTVLAESELREILKIMAGSQPAFSCTIDDDSKVADQLIPNDVESPHRFSFIEFQNQAKLFLAPDRRKINGWLAFPELLRVLQSNSLVHAQTEERPNMVDSRSRAKHALAALYESMQAMSEKLRNHLDFMKGSEVARGVGKRHRRSRSCSRFASRRRQRSSDSLAISTRRRHRSHSCSRRASRRRRRSSDSLAISKRHRHRSRSRLTCRRRFDSNATSRSDTSCRYRSRARSVDWEVHRARSRSRNPYFSDGSCKVWFYQIKHLLRHLAADVCEPVPKQATRILRKEGINHASQLLELNPVDFENLRIPLLLKSRLRKFCEQKSKEPNGEECEGNSQSRSINKDIIRIGGLPFVLDTPEKVMDCFGETFQLFGIVTQCVLVDAAGLGATKSALIRFRSSDEAAKMLKDPDGVMKQGIKWYGNKYFCSLRFPDDAEIEALQH